MIVLVTGSRDWDNEHIVRKALSTLPNKSTIIHGGARGADTIAGKIANELLYEVIVYRADWKRYGMGAGVIRNQHMLDDNPIIDIVFAFSNHFEDSRGTRDMIKRCTKRDLLIKLFTYEGRLKALLKGMS